LSAIVDVNGTDMEYSCNNTVKDMRLGLLRQSSTKQIKINQHQTNKNKSNDTKGSHLSYLRRACWRHSSVLHCRPRRWDRRAWWVCMSVFYTRSLRRSQEYFDKPVVHISRVHLHQGSEGKKSPNNGLNFCSMRILSQYDLFRLTLGHLSVHRATLI